MSPTSYQLLYPATSLPRSMIRRTFLMSIKKVILVKFYLIPVLPKPPADLSVSEISETIEKSAC